MSKPLLFLDVDGPINPHARSNRSARRARYVVRSLNGIQVRLNPAHGPALLALGYELVWATTWQHLANEHIAWRLGLPELPVCEFPSQGEGILPLYFKTPYLVRYAQGRRFAWVDDEMGQADREYVARCHPGRALLHHVDPAVGLAEEDFATLAAWATP